MTTVRELTGELSFNADTTGATRFDQAVNRSKSNLEQLNSVSLVPFVGTMTKAWGLVTGAATLGTAAAAKRFIDLEKAYDGLETATEDTAGTIRGEIESILEDKLLKNLVDEIDLVGAALQTAQNEGVTGAGQITRFLRLATSLSVVTQKSVGELLEQLVAGDVQSVLKLIGQLPLELQEIFKAGGIGPEQQGLIGRRALVEQRLLAVQDKIEKRIAEQRERGLTTFDELGGAFEKLTIEIGERSLPTFKDLNDVVIPLVEKLTKFVRGEIGLGDVILSEQTQKLRKGEIGTTEFIFGKPLIEETKKRVEEARERGFQPRRLAPSPFGAEFRARQPIRTTTQTNDNRSEVKVDKIEIRVEGGETGRQTGENVAKELRRVMGQMSEQAKQGTIKRGGR